MKNLLLISLFATCSMYGMEKSLTNYQKEFVRSLSQNLKNITECSDTKTEAEVKEYIMSPLKTYGFLDLAANLRLFVVDLDSAFKPTKEKFTSKQLDQIFKDKKS